MPSQPPAIQINGLSKRYSPRGEYALKDLSLSVMPGEVYGFLGPNGAGKSTTIRLLMNFIQPSEGSAKILGQDVVRDSVRLKRSVGYLAGDVALYPKMTGRQLLEYMSELTPVKHKEYLKELVSTYEAQLDKPIRELSKGNRQKIGLIQAFMHQPDVLILDEPTSGLDPLMQAVFFDYVKSARAGGASVFLSSHDLSEVQKMCDRVGFIRAGKLVTEETIGASAGLTSIQTYDITFDSKVPLEALKTIPGAEVTLMNDQTASVRLDGDLAGMFKELAKHRVKTIERRTINLEEEFMHLYNGDAS